MLKTTTNWNELTVWRSWACSPQTHWCLRTDHFNHPVASISTSWRTVHMLITCPVNPLSYLAFKNALWNPWGSEFRKAWATQLRAWPYNEPFSPPDSRVSVLSGLIVCQAHKPAFSNTPKVGWTNSTESAAGSPTLYAHTPWSSSRHRPRRAKTPLGWWARTSRKGKPNWWQSTRFLEKLNQFYCDLI